MNPLDARIDQCWRSDLYNLMERFEKAAELARLIFDDEHLPVIEDTDMGVGIYYTWGDNPTKRSQIYVWYSNEAYWVSWAVYVRQATVPILKITATFDDFKVRTVPRVKRELFQSLIYLGLD